MDGSVLSFFYRQHPRRKRKTRENSTTRFHFPPLGFLEEGKTKEEQANERKVLTPNSIHRHWLRYRMSQTHRHLAFQSSEPTPSKATPSHCLHGCESGDARVEVSTRIYMRCTHKPCVFIDVLRSKSDVLCNKEWVSEEPAVLNMMRLTACRTLSAFMCFLNFLAIRVIKLVWNQGFSKGTVFPWCQQLSGRAHGIQAYTPPLFKKGEKRPMRDSSRCDVTTDSCNRTSPSNHNRLLFIQ